MVTHNICRIQILRMDIQEIESVKNLLFLELLVLFLESLVSTFRRP